MATSPMSLIFDEEGGNQRHHHGGTAVPTAFGPGRSLSTRYPPRHEHTTTISGRPAHDPRQHARQRRAVARGVVLAVPPPGDPERRPVARSHASAIVRPAHGVHPVRHRRCRRPAELAGTTGAAERRWHCAIAMSAKRHRVPWTHKEMPQDTARMALGCNHVRKLTLMLFGLVTKAMILCSIWPVIGNFSTTCVMVLVDSIEKSGITKHCILFRFSQ
jgi:hypothetical protein